MSRVVTSQKLIDAITDFGRKELAVQTGISISQINACCSRERKFSPDMVLEKVVPTVWPKQHVMITDVWELAD